MLLLQYDNVCEVKENNKILHTIRKGRLTSYYYIDNKRKRYICLAAALHDIPGYLEAFYNNGLCLDATNTANS